MSGQSLRRPGQAPGIQCGHRQVIISRRPFMRSRTLSIGRLAMSARRFSIPIPVDANPVNRSESLHSLVEDIRAGKVDLLADSRRQSCLRRARRTRIRFGAEIECRQSEGVISARTATRPPNFASGTSPKRTISSLGAMLAPTTGRSALFSRSSSLFTAARARTKSSRFSRASPASLGMISSRLLAEAARWRRLRCLLA